MIDNLNRPVIRNLQRRQQHQQEEEEDTQNHLGILFNFAKTWKWQALTHRCSTHPEEAKVVNKDGETALHYCVFGNPPLDAVEALLDVYPAMAEMKNSQGQLPIHLACCYRTSSEVLTCFNRDMSENNTST